MFKKSLQKKINPLICARCGYKLGQPVFAPIISYLKELGFKYSGRRYCFPCIAFSEENLTKSD